MIEAAGARATLGLLTLAVLAACGLKGPLYLPDRSGQAAAPTEEDEQTSKRRTQRPAPQSQKEDGAQAPRATSDPDRSATPPPPKP
jgi:predicted small lipoprotein YifL